MAIRPIIAGRVIAVLGRAFVGVVVGITILVLIGIAALIIATLIVAITALLIAIALLAIAITAIGLTGDGSAGERAKASTRDDCTIIAVLAVTPAMVTITIAAVTAGMPVTIAITVAVAAIFTGAILTVVMEFGTDNSTENTADDGPGDLAIALLSHALFIALGLRRTAILALCTIGLGLGASSK